MEQAVAKMIATLEPYRVDEHIFEWLKGVTFGLRPNQTGDSLYFMKIKTSKAQRGLGMASETLSFLCRTADEYDVVLFLIIEEFDDGGLNEDALAAWYERHGFHGDPGEMIREPRSDE